MLPLVSVLLPVYKPDPKLLLEALESIISQEYPRLELIISIDGELPNLNLEVQLEQWIGRTNTRIVYHNGIPGIFSNLNYALNYVNGDYVQLFSQDDRMCPGFIGRQVAILKNIESVGMVFSSFDVINENGLNVNEDVNFTFRPHEDRLIKPEEATDLFIKFGCLPGNISPVMLRRSIFAIIGMFDENLPYAGDFEFWVRLSKTWDIFYLHNPGLQVRRHDNQASRTISNRQLFLDLVHIYRNLLESIPKEQLNSRIHYINRKVGSSFIHHTWISLLKGNSHLKNLIERWRDMQQYPFNAFWASTYYGISIPSRVIRRIRR